MSPLPVRSARRAGALAVLAAALAVPVAEAATITVNNSADYSFGDGPSDQDGKGCTLRKAIANANNNAKTYQACAAGSGSSNTIAFNGVSQITLGDYGSPFYINRNLVIQGPVIIDGSSEGDIFRVAIGGVDLSIESVTLKNGSNSAVKIMSSTSSFSANACAFVDNSSPSSGGGAIDSSGVIHINACSFENNASNGGAYGGGAIRLSAPEPSTISNSSFTNNSAKASGGAVHYSNPGPLASLTISNSNFLNNSAEAQNGASEGGGAIFHQDGLLTLLNSIFTHNTVTGDEGRGGALHLAVGSPTAILEHNLFTLNEASGEDALGGAIYAARAALVSGNSFISNRAEDNGRGGAIAASVKIKGSMDLEYPGFMLSNSTLHDNRATYGGGVYNFGAESGSVERGITLIHVTLDGNQAAQQGGGIYASEIQANEPPETDLRNSILSGNTAGSGKGNCSASIALPVLNNGGNVVWPADSCDALPAFAGSDVGDPRLGAPMPSVPPPVIVMEPQNGSFALQHGDPDTCADFPIFQLDQRLFPRPTPGGTPCDAGAFESSAGPPAPELDVKPDAGLAFGQVTVGTTATLQATVSNPGTLPLDGLELAVTGAGFSLDSDTCGATLAAGGSCSVVVAFQPVSGASFSGQLQASADDGLSDAITLSGSGFVATPGLNLEPDAGLNLGNQTVGGTSAFQTATLTNTGNVGLSGIAFQVAAPFQLAAGGTCSGSLAAGASCTQRVVFAPTQPGAASATLSVSSSQGPNDGIVVSGNGTTPPNLVLAPADGLAFGRVPLGTQSGIRQATLTNTGTATANLLGFNWIGVQNGFALVGDDCPSSLLGGQSCTLDFRFTPPGSSAVNALFRAQASIFLYTSNTIELTGQGYSPARLLIVPESGIDFGAVQTGTTSEVANLSIRNMGGEPYELTEVGVAPPFTATPGCALPTTIVPGAACPVQVSVTPTQDGEVRSNVFARGDAPAADPGQTVELSHQVPVRAEGFTPADLVLSPAGGLAFGPVAVGQTSASKAVTFTNPGSLDLFMLGFSLPAPFQIVSENCSLTLPGGASCQAQVAFAPASEGDSNGNLNASGIPSGQGSVLRSLPLSGNGFTPAPQLTWTPTPGLHFGAVTVGTNSPTQTATLTNLGPGVASIGISLGLTPGFQIAANSCGATLAAGAQCTVQVRYAPVAVGAAASALIANAGGGVSQQLPLSGEGVAAGQPAFQSTPGAPGPLTFAAALGQASTRTVQVSNVGSATLHVGQPGLSGTGAGDFLILTPMPMQLAPGASQAVQISCTPNAGGGRNASLSLATTDPAKPSVLFGLNCEGLVPLFRNGFERDPADL